MGLRWEVSEPERLGQELAQLVHRHRLGLKRRQLELDRLPGR